MVRRLTLIFLLAALAGGVVAGTPLHSSSGQMMKCCDKAKSKEQTPAANATRMCCALNCSDSAPTSSAGSFNLSPSNFTIAKSIAEQIAALFAEEKAASLSPTRYSREILARTFQPKYIQNSSFLI